MASVDDDDELEDTRENRAHPYVEYDDFGNEKDGCPDGGCRKCADPHCPACKGTGKVRHGNTWQCGCSHEVVGSKAQEERIENDLETMKRVPRVFPWFYRRMAFRAPPDDDVCGANPPSRICPPCVGRCDGA